MPRYKNLEWNLKEAVGGRVPDAVVQMAVLMDIRDELERLNRLLHCPNFSAIPGKLDRIVKNTTKPRGKKRKVKHA